VLNPTRRRCVARTVPGLVFVLAAAVLGATPGQAAPAGALGAEMTLSTLSTTGGTRGNQVANFPDGTTVVAWTSGTGAKVFVRRRAPGANTWGPLRTYTVPVGWTAEGDPLDPGLFLFASGPSEFLLGWQESDGINSRLEVSRLAAGAALIPTPVKVSGADTTVMSPGISVNSAGRAIATWRTSSGASPGSIRYSVRLTPTSAWSTPASLGTATLVPATNTGGFNPIGAVAENGSMCVVWAKSTGAFPATLTSRCRATTTFAGPVTMGLTQYALGSPTTLASLTAAGNGFVVAASIPSTGTVNVPISSPGPPTKVRVYSKASASATWSIQATYGQVGQALLVPHATGATDGSAVIDYLQIDGSIGAAASDLAPNYLTSRFLAQRIKTGSWIGPVVISAAAANVTGVEYTLFAGPIALGPDGAAIVPTMVQNGTTNGVLAASLRGTWASAFGTPTNWSDFAAFAADAISASSRATIVAIGIPSVIVTVRSTALRKPFLRSAAKLSAAPKHGVSLTCRVSWTDAAGTATYAWLRNGAAIGGATAVTYKPGSADIGKKLSCRSKATNPAGSTTTTSTGLVVS